ncbi:hypothetical protein ACJMK2_015188 [Sinanodonta woodiana]|uniref:Uncharacterized protein n=1 Tax=Sinanodonta woodiana TaxID=1069815 RepID=A0ABD3V4R3_SINWO
MATGGKEQVRYSLVKERTITLKHADNTPLYISIVICQDKIIVVDIRDGKVRIHRRHDGKLLDMLDRDSRPRDICLMDATTICVLHGDGLIKMVSIKSEDVSPVFTRMKSFRLDGVFDWYHSVVRVHDNIVVVGVKQGTTYWCIVSPEDGHVDTIHRICKESSWSSVTTKDNIIYISCGAHVDDDDHGVYGFDILNPSQCKYKYKHERLQWPRSIVINEDGNIFVVNGGFDPCIHQLTSSCQPVAIFSVEGIPWGLHAMFWDNGRLYVTRLGSRDITVFRHVHQGNRNKSEVLLSDEGTQASIVESAIQISQGNVSTSSMLFI